MERLPDYQSNVGTRIGIQSCSRNVATLQRISQTQQTQLNSRMPFKRVLRRFKSSPTIQSLAIKPPKPASTPTFPLRMTSIPLFLKHDDCKGDYRVGSGSELKM